MGALVGLAVFLTLLSLKGPPPSDRRLNEQALDAVSHLERALDEDDVGAVMGLLAPEWAVLDLPGSVRQVLPPGDPADQLRLYVETVDIDLAACEAEPAADPVTRLVRCDARVVGALPAAIGHASAGEVIVGVDRDSIVSVFRELRVDEEDASLFYCIWAEVDHPEMAADAFDINCSPIGSAAVHNRLAAMYVDAGRPAPTAQEFTSRVAVGVVIAVEGFQHDPDTLARIFSNDSPLVRYPGLLPAELRSPFPSVREYLAWSDVVYEVELGDCEIGARLQSGGYRVECSEARWAGALVTHLGLQPIEQPVSFFVEEGLISGVVGTTSGVLDGAVAELCQWARRNREDQAGTAFRADCAPQYTPEGAAEILALAGEYAGRG
jgi:hypothetical protein